MTGSSINPDILKRYLEGKCSSEELALVERWYREIEHRNLPPDLNQPQHLSKIKGEISKIEAAQKKLLSPSAPPLTFRRIYLAAASLVVLAGLSFLIVLFKNNQPENHLMPGSETAVLTNTQTGIVKYQLPDKSYVWLHPDATLRYDEASFSNGARLVGLHGEAFFDIASDPQKPFIVEVGSMRVKVLGTSFLVRPGKNPTDYEVAVISGKVEVYSENKTARLSQPVVLSPDEKVSFDVVSGLTIASKMPVADPHIDTWQPASLSFNDTRMREVARQLELKFGKKVDFEDKDLGNCVLKASFENHRLIEVLESISEMMELTYEMNDTKVVLRGSGCAENF